MISAACTLNKLGNVIKYAIEYKETLYHITQSRGITVKGKLHIVQLEVHADHVPQSFLQIATANLFLVIKIIKLSRR